MPKSLGNLCNLRDISLSGNNFGNISLTFLLESFFECKSPSLESLFIYDSRLSSHLPDQLGQLKHLVYLVLEDNGIVGTIPDSIGRLSYLKHIDLGGNHISGQIPFSIKGLSSLEDLVVSNNQLSGSLPESLGLLSNLKYLDISYNLLTGIVTDAHFASLNRLKRLNGAGNNLILRPRHANWHPHFRLEILILSSWDIGPQFPLWLTQQKDLMLLDISNTQISSTMPLTFWRYFPNLHSLDMSQNYIQGRLCGIPSTIMVLNVSYNKFSGQSNSSLTLFLDLSYNSFVGLLQHLICPYGGKQLEVLNLANNHLSGPIPNRCWEKYPNLTFLSLENNNLSGKIPVTVGSLSYLTSLSMCNNKLSRRLPTSLKNLTNLSTLQLAKNKFVGRIPTWIGTELLALRILNLRSNNFHRTITRELCYLTSIQILDLSHNNLSGDIPRCFNNFTILSGKEVISADRFIFLAYNMRGVLDSASLVIKGREDRYRTILQLVIILDLSRSIPDQIGDLKSLVSFDVSFSQLSGTLPISLSSLTFLSSFNVSYNKFTGRIPTSTQLQSFSESCFFGNRLCGDPLIKSCAVALPNDGQEKEEKDGSHGSDWGLIISMVTRFIAGFWVVLAPLIVNTTWRIAYFGFLRDLRTIAE
ncbi:receptor-like protein EIX2 [Bidens hawaiensis]|uniref:receptor-like protein EIX2 n=1 Tax=Bidens hawaiensis TaxID=980011 RepID=UPI0040499D40